MVKVGVGHVILPVWLCDCHVTEKDEESGEESGEGEEEEEEDEEEEVQTVVYFWQGRNASKMGWLHFTLG